MLSRIDWVISNCRLLAGIGAEYEQTQPFAGLTIGTGIHLEPKTVALLLTLARGGARVVSTGNLNSTQQSAVDHLRAHGLTVIGGPTRDQAVHDADLAEVLSHRPDLILDNGGDLFARYLENPYEGLRGGTEETTSGRARLALLRDQLAMPVLVINDSPIKQFAENRHAVGQSVLESLMRITNLVTNGRRVTVFGYGSCGKGVALNLRNAHAVVTVVESDPVLRLEALLDGFLVTSREEALSSADVVITVTGAGDVVTAADLDLFRDDVILANAGHFPIEIDVPGLRSDARVTGVTAYSDGIEVLELADGRALRVLGEGHMVNLTGPRPLGNSLESMDLGFALQARCLEAVARGAVDGASCVVPVPADIDARVADDYVTGVTGAPSLLTAAG